MTEERFMELMADVTTGGADLGKIEADNALMGLMIILKYLPKKGIEAAQHDVVYGASVEDVIEAGITEEDTVRLRRLNWIVDEDFLACFV